MGCDCMSNEADGPTFFNSFKMMDWLLLSSTEGVTLMGKLNIKLKQINCAVNLKSRKTATYDMLICLHIYW